MATNRNLELALKIKALVEGAKDVDQLASSLRGVVVEAKSSSGIDGARKQLNGLASSMGDVASLAARGLGLAGLVTGLKSLVTGLTEAGLRAEKLGNQLAFAMGSAAAGAREMDFVRTAADKLGLDLVSAAGAYGKLAASSQGTALAGGKTRDIFLAVSKASTVMGLSASETEGALLAISQMMSKGMVQAEELRGQLGERLPGAFNIAARAMGVTTAELGKMLEQGEVIASDFLPRFAKELERTLGDAPQSAAASAQAQLNRFSTAWENLKQTMANSGFLKVAAAGISELADTMKRIDSSDRAQRDRLVERIDEFEKHPELLVPGTDQFRAYTNTLREINALDAKRAQAQEKALKQAEAQKKAAQDLDAGRAEARAADVLARQDRTALDKFLGDQSHLTKAAKLSKDLEDENKAFTKAVVNFAVGSEDYKKALKKHEANVAAIKEKGAGGRKTPDQERNLLAVTKEQLDKELGLIREQLKFATEAYDQAYRNQLIGIEGYYAARNEIAARAIDEERRRNEQLIAVAQGKKPRDVNEARKIEAEISELQQRNVFLGQQKAAQEARFADEAKRAKQALADQLADVELQIAKTAGNATEEQIRSAAERANRTLLDTARANEPQFPGGEALIQRKIDIDTARAQLDDLETRANQVLGATRATEDSINIQRQAGLISEIEARRQILDLNQKSAAQLDEMLPAMRAQAEILGDPAKIRIQELTNQIGQLKIVTSEWMATMEQAFTSGVGTLFNDLVSKSKTASQAFHDFGRSVISAVNNILVQTAAKNIWDSILKKPSAGGTGGASGVSGLFGDFGKWIASFFHEGGIVGAGGVRTMSLPALAFAAAPRYHSGGFAGLASDEVPAILRRGEEVLTQSDPRHRANGGGMTVVNQFTVSGPVTRQSESQIAAAAGEGISRAMRRIR